MGSPPRSSPSLSWRRVLCVLFLPLVSSGFAPPVKQRNNFIFERRKLHPNPRRFDWSHLTPRQLKNRSRGIQTEEQAGRNPYFTLEGHEFLILGGSVHYFRVPRASWRDRLLKLRACGFNTVTTYVPWNLHEPQRGTFDFSGNLDLEAFILLAEEVGLWVILRPGPYICSEMDLGGLPSWLLQDPTSQLRTTNRSFVNAVNKYFDHLIPRVAPLQYRRGGPIIAVQVENEYGSFYKDKAYMPYLLQALLQRGIGGLLLTADSTEEVTRGHTKGVLATINMKGFKVDSFKHLYKLQSHKPIVIMEFWVGWFDTWGNDHKVVGVNEVEKSVSEFIRFGISFNVYMFHGGTNFGFMNGATSFEKHRGVTTSYDYDAVLTEAGDYTTKYFALRNLFESILVRPLPPLPSPTPKTVYPSLKLSHYLPLWEALPYLQRVFLNETSLGILTDVYRDIDIPSITECQLLRILVENQGRVNFSWKIQNQQKGLIGPVTLDKIPLSRFTIYSLELKMTFFKKLRSAPWRPLRGPSSSPAFHLGTLMAGSSPQDTFLQLPWWSPLVPRNCFWKQKPCCLKKDSTACHRAGSTGVCSSMAVTLGGTGILGLRKRFTCLAPGSSRAPMRSFCSRRRRAAQISTAQTSAGFDSRLVETWMCYLWMWRTNCAYNPNTAPGLNSKQRTKNRLITSLCCVEVSRSLASNLVSRGKKEPSCLAGGESETAFYSTVGNGWLD
ncbi:beta-galactosidase-1-like protein 3 isoform X2 [Cervus elaphus]|uniref:beta-galactosidase-1-like protein 3 isoform X2 n=1 Tax=Cervus elaphus TaxID=9860 RepID=UPI001CC326FE|nr:beta-galactosidase-1-like protein 3 isoform X2 [Cervus elaphus]